MKPSSYGFLLTLSLLLLSGSLYLLCERGLWVKGLEHSQEQADPVLNQALSAACLSLLAVIYIVSKLLKQKTPTH